MTDDSFVRLPAVSIDRRTNYSPSQGSAIISDIVEALVAAGDLKGLTPQQRVEYYTSVCERLQLDPISQPFQYLMLNGKLVLYATKGAAEQLRRVHGISMSITDREIMEGVFVVTVSGATPDGRTDTAIGAVPIDNLKGEARANAMMKAETKAKRRLTLSMLGLGMLDETEVDTIPGAIHENIDPQTGEMRGALPEAKSPKRPNGAASKRQDSPALAEFKAAFSEYSDAVPNAISQHIAVVKREYGVADFAALPDEAIIEATRFVMAYKQEAA